MNEKEKMEVTRMFTIFYVASEFLVPEQKLQNVFLSTETYFF